MHTLRSFLKAIRIHQWSKNILVFVPLLTAHKLSDPHLFLKALDAFLAFSLCASGVYLLNDLVDLDSDRRHPKKKNRPFAAGDLSLITGKILIPCFFAASLLIAFRVESHVALLLLLYAVLTTAYSLSLKKIALIDVMILATLYTIRLFTGAMATGVPISHWLLAFSMFFFLNLAFVKRFSELHLLHVADSEVGIGRGYMGKDLGLISDLGTSSGYVSVVILALYVQSETISELYRRSQLLWLLCPLFLYWISRIWLMTRRGLMHDDPILFAIRDKVSYVVGLLLVLVVLFAT